MIGWDGVENSMQYAVGMRDQESEIIKILTPENCPLHTEKKHEKNII